jgi:hypothetical protein
MKLSKRTIEDLLTLISHVRADINYGGNGTYNKDDGHGGYAFDEKDGKKSERAIEAIKKIILSS